MSSRSRCVKIQSKHKCPQVNVYCFGSKMNYLCHFFRGVFYCKRSGKSHSDSRTAVKKSNHRGAGQEGSCWCLSHQVRLNPHRQSTVNIRVAYCFSHRFYFLFSLKTLTYCSVSWKTKIVLGKFFSLLCMTNFK